VATYLTDAELARLERMTGEAHKDTAQRMLTEADLDDAAFLARVPDVAGLNPQTSLGVATTGYVDTVDLYKAASIAWHQKAGVYAEQFAFTADGATFQRNQGYDMCIKQAARYADMASGWTPVDQSITPVTT